VRRISLLLGLRAGGVRHGRHVHHRAVRRRRHRRLRGCRHGAWQSRIYCRPKQFYCRPRPAAQLLTKPWCFPVRVTDTGAFSGWRRRAAGEHGAAAGGAARQRPRAETAARVPRTAPRRVRPAAAAVPKALRLGYITSIVSQPAHEQPPPSLATTVCCVPSSGRTPLGWEAVKPLVPTLTIIRLYTGAENSSSAPHGRT
jgi:hypothetical protein